MNGLTRNLLNSIARGDNETMNAILKTYQLPGGVVNYERLMQIPVGDRIPGLVKKYSKKQIHLQATAVITLALEKINLRVPLNEKQIVELADMVIEQSGEDFLAFEDLVLFLQQLVRGEAGKIYDRMDIPTFFELFETYREKRHQAKLEHDWNHHLAVKGDGPSERLSEKEIDERNQFRHAMTQHMINNAEPKP